MHTQCLITFVDLQKRKCGKKIEKGAWKKGEKILINKMEKREHTYTHTACSGDGGGGGGQTSQFWKVASPGRIHTDFTDSDDKYVSLLMHVDTIGGLIATI